MRASHCRVHSPLLCLSYLMMTVLLTGCAHTRSEIAHELSEYWGSRAQEAQFKEAEKAHARKAKENALYQPGGSIEEVVKTDYTITLEKGMEIESVDLDFEKVKEMALLQEEMDKAHAEAMKAYGKLAADAERKRLANYMANAQAEANGTKGCEPQPDCARPEKEEGMAPPPPKRNALGMENLPIVIRARYSLTPRASSFAKTEVERKFQPGKAPCEPICCPKCGKSGCTHSECCTESDNLSHPSMGNEPTTAPASEVRRQPSLRQNPTRSTGNELERNLFGLSPIGSNLFEGDLNPVLLSFEK